MSKLDEYRDAQTVVEQLGQVKAAVIEEADGPQLQLAVSGRFEDSKAGLSPLVDSMLADAIGHHMPAIVETALGLAGASLMEAKAQAALEAAATLTELQPVEDLAEGA